MYKRHLTHSAETCVRIGRQILPGLEADPLLTAPAATLRAVQESLEAKVTAWISATKEARRTRANRDESMRKLADLLREFAFVLLALSRNDFQAVIFRRYYPDGYGEAHLMNPEELAAFAGQILTKLAEEVEPKILACRDALTAARDAFVAAETECASFARARDSAFEVMEADKLVWVRGLTAARLQASEVCYDDQPRLRSLFRVASERRRPGLSEEPEQAAESVAEPDAQPAAGPPGRESGPAFSEAA
jgi:hypothetical protein